MRTNTHAQRTLKKSSPSFRMPAASNTSLDQSLQKKRMSASLEGTRQ
jgi:hypothetical protein